MTTTPPSKRQCTESELQRTSTVAYGKRSNGAEENHHLKPLSSFVTPMLTDMYQITMTYSLWKNNRHNVDSAFDLFFRKNPFHGEFTIFAGLEEVIRFLDDFSFKKDQIESIRKMMPVEEEFYEWLSKLDCKQITVRALREGCPAFPRVPLIRVEGPLGICQLLETTLLCLVNFASLVTTNAARICLAAGPGKEMLEFGLRRAQGPDGAVSASRYSYLGGFDGTSNVLAHQLFGIPIRGTHAHSYVTSFSELADFTERKIQNKTTGEEVNFWDHVNAARSDLDFNITNEGELVAFAAYARTFPNAFVALVDTYDTLSSGVPNFLAVALALHRLGYKPIGVRLDSGDLAYLSIETRKLFVKAAEKLKLPEFAKFKITVSNDLDEETIRSLNQRRDSDTEKPHEIDAYAVGTNLVTCQTQPALGCVYKLVEIAGKPRIKLSQDVSKISLPGKKDAYRLWKGGFPLVDIMIPAGSPAPVSGEVVECRHPFEEHKRAIIKPDNVEPLHLVVWDKGTLPQPIYSLSESRAYCQQQIKSIRNDHLRALNPTPYKVSLNKPLHDILVELRNQMMSLRELS
eukprot:TRINITY_DN2857_c0_g1_i1.p1 TRINITY_DN2857_c0_g1~~TRINITY_DN2857_c0_g1_i1.p1  ORF type:complete len:573 (-),score=143.86 TRINITY_DN2857_c0_g1_i1:25-1743(-)